MKKRFVAFSALAAIVVIVLVILGFQTYQKRALIENQGKESAANQATEEQAQRKLEQESNFYAKLQNGFDVKILVIGNSMALSEGASTDGDWLQTLAKELEDKYHVNVRYKNIASAYSGYGAGFVKVATLDDVSQYDAAIICYPAAELEEELIQYEAIIRQIKKSNSDCAIISILANSDKNVSPDETTQITNYYGGISINMQDIISQGGSKVIDHEFYPNDAGYKLYAKETFNSINDAIYGDKNTQSDVVNSLREKVKEYDYCTFVSISKCRKTEANTFFIDVEGFSGRICICACFKKGNQIYDIYHDSGKWLTRNELSYATDCWYDSFLFHEIPDTNKEIMFILGGDSSIDQILGVYLIAHKPIVIKSGING